MKYSNYIYTAARQSMGLEFNDESKDTEIDQMSLYDIIDHVMQWEGIYGYTTLVLEIVKQFQAGEKS
jgi:hypothetical protein